MYSRLDKQDRFGPNVANNVRSGLEVTSKEIAAAEAYRADLCRQIRQLFNEYDHLLTPCVAVPPFPVEQNFPDTIAGKPMKTYIDWIAPTFVLSLTGLPVACVPAGLDPTGMPVGLQVAGGHLGEEDVLARGCAGTETAARHAATVRLKPGPAEAVRLADLLDSRFVRRLRSGSGLGTAASRVREYACCGCW